MILGREAPHHATFDQRGARPRTVQPRTNGARAPRLTNLAAVPVIRSASAVIRKCSSRAWCCTAAIGACLTGNVAAQPAGGGGVALNDVHFPLTNYVQRGTDIRAFLKMMG